VKVVSVNNPELKLSLEGGKEAIEALRELIFALPRFIASLFKPRAASELADLEADAEKRRLEAKAAAATADKEESEVRRLKAELELLRLRQEIANMPIRADADAHALLWDIVKQMQATDPAKRQAFVADTARYMATTRGLEPTSQIALIPLGIRPGRH
jgi:hypothetical protein